MIMRNFYFWYIKNQTLHESLFYFLLISCKVSSNNNNKMFRHIWLGFCCELSKMTLPGERELMSKSYMLDDDQLNVNFNVSLIRLSILKVFFFSERIWALKVSFISTPEKFILCVVCRKKNEISISINFTLTTQKHNQLSLNSPNILIKFKKMITIFDDVINWVKRYHKT
jgi:hypothetical protein